MQILLDNLRRVRRHTASALVLLLFVAISAVGGFVPLSALAGTPIQRTDNRTNPVGEEVQEQNYWLVRAEDRRERHHEPKRVRRADANHSRHPVMVPPAWHELLTHRAYDLRNGLGTPLRP